MRSLGQVAKHNAALFGSTVIMTSPRQGETMADDGKLQEAGIK